ncbi:MAG: hypothetical protein ACREAW_06935, partial [Nitrososphaera sp.]
MGSDEIEVINNVSLSASVSFVRTSMVIRSASSAIEMVSSYAVGFLFTVVIVKVSTSGLPDNAVPSVPSVAVAFTVNVSGPDGRGGATTTQLTISA